MNKITLNLKERLGDTLLIEDAVVLRQELQSDINDKKITLNFQNIYSIPNNFFSTLLVPLQESVGRDVLFNNLNVINLTNKEKDNYERVYYGTSNINE